MQEIVAGKKSVKRRGNGCFGIEWVADVLAIEQKVCECVEPLVDPMDKAAFLKLEG